MSASFVELIEQLGTLARTAVAPASWAVFNQLLGVLEAVKLEEDNDRLTYTQRMVPLLMNLAIRVPLGANSVAEVCGALGPATLRRLDQYGQALQSTISPTAPLDVLYFVAVYKVYFALTSCNTIARPLGEHLRRQATLANRTILEALGDLAEVDDCVKYGVSPHRGTRLALVGIIAAAICYNQGPFAQMTSGEELDEKHADQPSSSKRRRLQTRQEARAAGKKIRIRTTVSSDEEDQDNGHQSNEHAPPPRPTHPDLSEQEHLELAKWLDDYYAEDLKQVCRRLGIDRGYTKADHVDSIIEALGWGVYTHPALSWTWRRS